MLKLVSFHVQAHLNAFLKILEYFSQICLLPLARGSPVEYPDFIFVHAVNHMPHKVQVDVEKKNHYVERRKAEFGVLCSVGDQIVHVSMCAQIAVTPW